MKIQNFQPSQPLKTLKAPQPDPQPGPQAPKESFVRSDHAFQAASHMARTQNGINMGVAGGVAGGALVGIATDMAFGVTGLSVAAGVVTGCVLGFGGFVAGRAMSDWAGNLGAKIDASQPKRGEAIARNVMTAATGVIFVQSPTIAAFQVGASVALGAGVYAVQR